MHECAKCGTKFEGNFCPECGTSSQKEKACPLCGVTLGGGVKFCTNCGYFFGKKFKPEDSPQEKNDEKQCVISPLVYSLNDDKASYTVAKMESSCKETEIVILETVNDLPVTAIGRYAFKDCNELTGVTIPDTITSINDGAFTGCTKLTNLTLPKSIGYIGSYAFYHCESLTKLAVPDSVTELKSCVLGRCSNLISVIIPSSVTEIKSCAFRDCKALKSLIIPHGVISIGSCAFEGCSALKSITLPGSVTSIGSGAFGKCKNLTCMIIPNSVTEIRSYTFDGCGNLAHIGITYRGTKSEWNEIAKSDDWAGSGAYCVHCIDGDIA